MAIEVPKYSVLEFIPQKHPYCLCIPVINEGEKIRKELSRIHAAGISKLIDIIICDGGSTDGSLDAAILKEYGVSVLLTKQDSGKLSAQLRMGYYFSLLQRQYEGIITIDGNNKDSVEDIPKFMRKLDEGYDLVQGSRFLPEGAAINTPRIRHLAVKLLHIPIISLAARFKYTDTTNGYRAYSRKFLLDPRVAPFRHIFMTYELLAYLSVRAPKLHFKVTEIPVTRTYPPTGKTPTKISFIKGNWSLIKILWHVLRQKYNPKAKR